MTISEQDLLKWLHHNYEVREHERALFKSEDGRIDFGRCATGDEFVTVTARAETQADAVMQWKLLVKSFVSDHWKGEGRPALLLRMKPEFSREPHWFYVYARMQVALCPVT